MTGNVELHRDDRARLGSSTALYELSKHKLLDVNLEGLAVQALGNRVARLMNKEEEDLAHDNMVPTPFIS